VTLEFRILDPLDVLAAGRQLQLTGARARGVLAMLLVHANRVVSADQLIEELWAENAWHRAGPSLQVRVSELRRLLRSAGAGDRLTTRSSGYALRVEPGELDAARFEALLEDGRAAEASGECELALAQLDEALGLWRGDALAQVLAAPSARSEAARLQELRMGALEWRSDAQLALGRHDELVAELEALTAVHPLRERLWSRRMIALYRTGRQADALRAFRCLRARLVDELGIEPSRELRDLELRILRQDPELDAGPGPGDGRHGAAVPTTRYVKSGDVHIAYQVVGSGDRDIVLVPGLVSHLDLWWEDRAASRFLRRLASFGRLIMFDKRDTGLSDRAPGDAGLDRRIADLCAVLDACGSDRIVLFGLSEGGPLSMVFTAMHPERVSGVILGGAAARWSSAADYPCGRESDAMLAALEQLAHDGWGRGDSLDWYAPSRSGSSRARQAFARWERMAVSPSSLLRLLDMLRRLDVRAVLPAIRTPTLVLQRLDDRISPRCHCRCLADHIAGARYFEQPGDHVPWVGDTDRLFTEVSHFLAAVRPRAGPPSSRG
jgi:DNA-binding SARP family transcriptional activator/pimeloyl-ACP methyl ester carboxylesterase